MPREISSLWQDRLSFVAVLLVFFFLLGTRGLNEPDEGRYAEIAREMVETGDWLVPHIWHVPHLDKPPMTYWLVASSLKCFGFNEWAVRLPLALAGLSGVLATWLLGRSMGGARVARWGALILASSTLYFVMARMLTTDIILTQFIVWAICGFWHGWRCLDGLESGDEEMRSRAARRFFGWNLLAWLSLAGGFLCKGPIALAIPLVALLPLAASCRKDAARRSLVVLGVVLGAGLFLGVALPWFLQVFQAVPHSFDFMTRGQMVAHALGAAAKNRSGSFFYFFVILPLGFLPWTPLLGWLWRRSHWRTLAPVQREAWILLTTWVAFTFVFFTLNSAKLPAYVLPLFPALALLVALRWPDWDVAPMPIWAQRVWSVCPWIGVMGFALAVRYVFQAEGIVWVWPVVILAAASSVVLTMLACRWTARALASSVAVSGLAGLLIIAALVPDVETKLKSNQTLKSLGEALRREFRPGDRILCWGRFPQGLPFYAHPVIDSFHLPYLAGLPLHRIPFEFPGNRERFGDLLLADDAALLRLLNGETRVLVVGFQGALEQLQPFTTNGPLRRVMQSGQWELLATR